MTTTALRSPPGRKRVHRTPYVLLAPTVLLLAVLFVVPTLYNLWLALHEVTPYDAMGQGEFVGLENFAAVLGDERTAGSTRNTVLWLTAATVVARILLGLGLALLLQAPVLRRLRLLTVSRTVILLPWMIPPTVAVAAWKWLLDGRTGLVNKILIELGFIDQGIPFLAETSTVWVSVISIMVWRELPFVVIAFMAALQSVPTEQYEAAAIDGSSSLGSLWYITLPNLRPVIVIVTLMISIGAFNNFIYVWLATGGGPGTYTQVLATQLFTTAFIDTKLGEGAAIGILMGGVMLVAAAIYLLLVLRREDD